jgi:hypothetical protein
VTAKKPVAGMPKHHGTGGLDVRREKRLTGNTRGGLQENRLIGSADRTHEINRTDLEINQ